MSRRQAFKPDRVRNPRISTNALHYVARIAAGALLCAAGVCAAQQFPSKPIRIVVPFPAGGSFDVTARILAQRMQLGQTILVENRPGGGTVIGTEYVARQPGDGHILLSIGPSFTMHHAVRSKVPFDTEKDFKAVAQIMGLTMIIAVNPSLPVKNMKEYLALARARPGEISYGTSGPGTSHNMLGEALKLAHKVNIVHAPFQGEAPAVTAAVGGHVTGVLVNLFSVAPFIKSGRLRGLVVSSAERDSLVPDVPTAREAGVPEIEAINWNGYVVHSATPSAVIARLNTGINNALNMPEVRELMRTQGMIATPGSAEQFAALLKSDGARYTRIAREANVRLD